MLWKIFNFQFEFSLETMVCGRYGKRTNGCKTSLLAQKTFLKIELLVENIRLMVKRNCIKRSQKVKNSITIHLLKNEFLTFWSSCIQFFHRKSYF